MQINSELSPQMDEFINQKRRQAKTQFCRHFKALMLKNAINWWRTKIGSLCEIFAPVLFMFLFVWVRTLIDPYSNDTSFLSLIQTPIFPVAKQVNGNWEVNPVTMAEQLDKVEPFLSYTDYPGLAEY